MRFVARAFILFFIGQWGSAAQAEIQSRNSIDLGYTSNVELATEAPKSDLYLRAATSNAMVRGRHTLGLRLSYLEYFSSNENDVLGLRLGDVWSHPDTGWKYGGALVGQLYPTGGAATTDTSFNNIGLDLYADRNRPLGSSTEFDYGFGYRMRVYPSLNGRNDHTLFGLASITYDATDELTLGANAEAGFVHSSVSDYGKTYFDLSGSVDYSFPADWDLSAELLFSQSFFSNRTVSATTEVVRRRGQTSFVTATAQESYSLTAISTELMKQQTEQTRWGFGLSSTRQTSVSGLQDYSVLEVMARFVFKF